MKYSYRYGCVMVLCQGWVVKYLTDKFAVLLTAIDGASGTVRLPSGYEILNFVKLHLRLTIRRTWMITFKGTYS